MTICHNCNGCGKRTTFIEKECSSCSSRGYSIDCSECEGIGKTVNIDNTCIYCKGSGHNNE